MWAVPGEGSEVQTGDCCSGLRCSWNLQLDLAVPSQAQKWFEAGQWHWGDGTSVPNLAQRKWQLSTGKAKD